MFVARIASDRDLEQKALLLLVLFIILNLPAKLLQILVERIYIVDFSKIFF